MSFENFKSYWIKAPLVLYVLGFIVHNTYLAKFGSHEFELVQAKYVISGFGFVAFSVICFAYCSIKVNLSYVADSLQIDKLLPWMLRVVSFPFVVYSALYSDSLQDMSLSNEYLENISLVFFAIANLVFAFSIFDLAFRYSEGEKMSARVIRKLHRVLAIPMLIGVLLISYDNSEFGAVAKASTFMFFMMLGLGLAQEDERHGIGADYLDENSKQKHKDRFSIFFGIIAIAFLLWMAVSNYVDAVYPKLPVALGGAKLENVEIHTRGKIVRSKLIQESRNWVLYINTETGNTEKLRASDIKKIVYLTE